ncbi:pyridoxamine 5'-phosphate oxidase family protein [Actinokineospora inagensis]|uniref:pyridoxamine 5'-phosphate oxidase family protein n=1 Tax=Actinokineospora inagensis TaxID=103730 RepID=UPI00047E611B|nr:pyridoxamine 5'-phosphate oxidase family protein [Actinokineospora inagensis]
MPLSLEEREQFLLEPHIASLAVAGAAGRGPLQVPVWYQYKPGGEAWILTAAKSRKARQIAEHGRFSLLVERLEPSIRYVTVEGPVLSTEEGTDEHLVEMCTRYVRPERLEAYIKYLKAEGQQSVITLKVEHWTSADLGQV